MIGPIQRFLRSAALAAATLSSVHGCADEQESLIVLGVVGYDEMCVVKNSGVFLVEGNLDAAFGTPYSAAVILSNQLNPQTMTTNSGIDNSELQLIEVDIDLDIPQSPEVLDALRSRDPALVSFTQPLPTNSLPGGGETGIAVDVITAPASRALSEELTNRFGPGVEVTVVATLVFHAERTGNRVGGVGDIESRTYSFPIKVGNGKLISCVTCEMSTCPAEIPSFVLPCGFAQDGPVVPSPCVM